MAKTIKEPTRLCFRWDEATEDGRTLVTRITLPVGICRRQLKKALRGYLGQMGFRDVNDVMRKMGLIKYVR